MPTLANHFRNCDLLNLGYGPGGRGPFVVRQEGSAPGSMTLKQERFLLRKDGTWVINLAVFALSEKDKEQFLFVTSGEAIKLLDGLPATPVVDDALPSGRTPEDLAAAAETTLTGIWGRLRGAKVSPPSS